jgi:hypothetical protein
VAGVLDEKFVSLPTWCRRKRMKPWIGTWWVPPPVSGHQKTRRPRAG